jgi:hypothetical protein
VRGDVRCLDGRLFRHDPQWDDPDLETDVGACAGCDLCEPDDEPVEHCEDCGAVVSGDGISIDERACFRCRGD